MQDFVEARRKTLPRYGTRLHMNTTHNHWSSVQDVILGTNQDHTELLYKIWVPAEQDCTGHCTIVQWCLAMPAYCRLLWNSRPQNAEDSVGCIFILYTCFLSFHCLFHVEVHQVLPQHFCLFLSLHTHSHTPTHTHPRHTPSHTLAISLSRTHKRTFSPNLAGSW